MPQRLDKLSRREILKIGGGATLLPFVSVNGAPGQQRVYTRGAFPVTHNMGTCRQNAHPRASLCNSRGQSDDIDNLFVSDGSQFTSSATVNSTLTIAALAIHQADLIAAQMVRREL